VPGQAALRPAWPKQSPAAMHAAFPVREAAPRQYDVVCFDEVSGISFDQKDGVNIMKGYMESGEFSRGAKASGPKAAM
jgi:predicted ATP-dependent Lon-type protease